MSNISKIIYLVFLSILFSCQQDKTESTETIKLTPLSEEDFTPIENIDPQIYFPTEENTAKDPNNPLTDMFRKKKQADMANPEKPRPFEDKDINQIENISHEQAWGALDKIFKFDWGQLGNKALEDLSQVVKTRLIFDNLDLKVVELAIAAGGTLPLHAQATPSVYHVLGGEAEVWSNDDVAKVTPGTSITFDSYAKKRVQVTSTEPLKILWFSWAPEGNKSYLESGYYLTGSNLHIQPIQAVLPNDFTFWDAAIGKAYQTIESPSPTPSNISKFIKTQKSTWANLNKTSFYPNTPAFKSASEIDWVDMMNLDPKSFFFAKDLKKLGSLTKMLSRMAKIKSVFRVKRPDSGYDLNYSYLAWGPQSKYTTHSHAICEFYYLLDGDVEYIINQQKYHAVPGNFYWHPPYYDHEMRGLKANVPFLSISGSWIPFGKRELFDLPFLLLEDIPEQKGLSLPDNFDFHKFNLNKNLEYGVI